MNGFEQFLVALDGRMTTPAPYGWFHLMFVALVIIATTLLCVFGKNAKTKTIKWTIFGIWIVMVVMELYKQINYSFNYNLATGKTWWDYQWYAFPFQLCSTPIVVLPFVIFCKEGKFRDAMIAYIATFAMFGGLVTFIYPADVFISTVGINLQTMIHHGLQIVSGIFLLVHEREKLNIRYFLRGIFVFLAMCALAMGLNLLAPTFTGETFNMFFISPYFPCTLPLLGDLIWPNVPYVVFLLIYIIGFIIAALAIYYIQFGIIKLCMMKKKAKK